MENVLTDFTKVADSKFYTNNDLHLNELIEKYTALFDDPELIDMDGNKGLLFRELIGTVHFEKVKINLSLSHLQQWYNMIEAITKDKIKNEIYHNLDVEKNEVFIQYTLKELLYILRETEKIQVDNSLSTVHSWIVEKVKEFITFIKMMYLNISDVKSFRTYKKIKWLGQKNVLPTLIYELWKGQTNEEGMTTDVMLYVDEKQDLMNFIRENFVDKDNKDYELSSLSGQLSDSPNKSDERATKKKIILKISKT